MISPLYLVKDAEGYFITCINGGSEWQMMPIEFWSEHNEECLWDHWHGEFRFGDHLYTCSYGLSAEVMRASRNAVLITILIIARGIYRKVCEWRGQEIYPMIVRDHDHDKTPERAEGNRYLTGG